MTVQYFYNFKPPSSPPTGRERGAGTTPFSPTRLGDQKIGAHIQLCWDSLPKVHRRWITPFTLFKALISRSRVSYKTKVFEECQKYTFLSIRAFGKGGLRKHTTRFFILNLNSVYPNACTIMNSPRFSISTDLEVISSNNVRCVLI